LTTATLTRTFPPHSGNDANDKQAPRTFRKSLHSERIQSSHVEPQSPAIRALRRGRIRIAGGSFVDCMHQLLLYYLHWSCRIIELQQQYEQQLRSESSDSQLSGDSCTGTVRSTSAVHDAKTLPPMEVLVLYVSSKLLLGSASLACGWP